MMMLFCKSKWQCCHKYTAQKVHILPHKPKLYFLCDVTTRHDTLTLSSPCIAAQEKVVTCWSRLSDSTARHARQARQARLARHVFRGVATTWTGADMFTSLFPEVVSEIDANSEHKRLYLYTRTRELLLLRRPPCWNKHGATRSHDARDVTQ